MCCERPSFSFQKVMFRLAKDRLLEFQRFSDRLPEVFYPVPRGAYPAGRLRFSGLYFFLSPASRVCPL